MEDTCVMTVFDRYRGCTTDILLDPEDYQRFSDTTWYVDKDGYARRNQWINGRTKTFLLHRCILNIEWQSAKETCVDHINGNKLDNRKSNLRIVSYAENASNRHAILTSTGVLRVTKSGNKYSARIRKNGKPVYIDSFADPYQASDAIERYLKMGQFPYEKRRQRQVLQKTMTGETIAKYASCAEAARKTGVCAENINRVANRDRQRKQAGGFLWEYSDEGLRCNQ